MICSARVSDPGHDPLDEDIAELDSLSFLFFESGEFSMLSVYDNGDWFNSFFTICVLELKGFYTCTVFRRDLSPGFWRRPSIENRLEVSPLFASPLGL